MITEILSATLSLHRDPAMRAAFRLLGVAQFYIHRSRGASSIPTAKKCNFGEVG
jgi:hypothetical protein